MYANSRLVHSAQADLHPDLDKVVQKHLATTFFKPYAPHNLAAFDAWYPHYQGHLPLILDAGCGVGRSTLALARQFPQAQVLGVDQSADRLARGKGDAWPENVRFVRADLVDFWRLLADADISLQRHYLLYPNPWPKPPHLQRRWHGHAIFPALLGVGGKLECRSNWHTYVRELARAIELATGQTACVTPYDTQVALTPFEQKYRDSGQALWQLTYTPM
jgi:tRNA (guanine-N7-)-methyltransferase